ncbi:uncharacterized protein LOC142312163 [Anomaloglossus baeobatrachus]|uniref:uncharacterized protein LOC142312163 n=1 Tax=Anomaloglossus baeobatrachus TaxID=238106 RepID=UPI003F4FBA85
MPSCIVNQCVNKSGRKGQNKDIKLHIFPNNIDQIIAWLNQTGQQFSDIQALASKIISRGKSGKYAICSGHFTPESYEYRGKTKFLKTNAIPTIFPTVSEGEKIIAESSHKDNRGRKTWFSHFISQGSVIEAAQQEEVCNPGFRNCSPQTDSSLLNSKILLLESVAEDFSENVSSVLHSPPSISTPISSKEMLHSGSLPESSAPLKKKTVPTILDPLSGDPSTKYMDRDKMVERILHLTLEILFRLTGEDYTVVKKTSIERCQAPVCERWGRPLSPIMGPPPHPLIHEDINDQKILELIYKMIELLTGEVPIRCQDVTVYFSMEEWEYLEGHKDLYKDVMMGVPQPLTSPVLSSERTTPERCPRPLLPQDCKQEDSNDYQGEDLTHINITETYVRGVEWCKEEIPTYGYPDDCTSITEGHLTSSIFKSDDLGRKSLYSYNMRSKELSIEHYTQVSTILEPLSGDLLYKRIFLIDPSRMNKNRDKMVERILQLTLEILFRLTGEDYTVVKKTSSERCQAPVSEGWGRSPSQITGPPPHPLIHEDINDQKILELTYKMIELLTGEVPIRCEDVTVYFSMEEWEYLEGHKEMYNNTMMEVPQPLTSLVLSSKRTTPERCPHPLLPQECKPEDPNVPQDYQGKGLTHINTTKTFVRGDEQSNEEIPTDNRPDDYTSRSVGHLTSSIFKSNDLAIIPDIPSSHHSKDLSYHPAKQDISSDTSQTIDKDKHYKKSVKYQSAITAKNPCSSAEYEKSISLNMSIVTHQKIPPKEKRFCCSVCGKCLSNKSAFVKHERVHTGEKPYSCSECGKCFTQKSVLVIHHRTHTGEKPYSCSECGKCFGDKATLVKHQRSHTGEKPYSCSECGKCFANKTTLITHQRSHTGEKPFSCLDCGKCFANKNTLVIHQRSHTGETPFSCLECGKCFTQKSSLVIHQRTHSGNKPYSCSECGKCFNRKSFLVVHHRSHTGEKPYSCSECGKRFTNKGYLDVHQRIHTGVKSYLCSECGKCFTLYSDLFQHAATHTGKKPLFSNAEYGKSVSLNMSLVTYQKIHTKEKNISCSECGKCFNNKSKLVIHERTHTGEKPYSCSECGKCFAAKSKLVTHQRIHTGEKPYSCLECGKCFTAKSKLDTHQRIHTGEKPYSCSQCGKCFADYSTLFRHQRTHTGEKPYSCSECGKCFTQKVNLLGHQRSHTGEKPYMCLECGKRFTYYSDIFQHKKTHTEKPT